MRILKIIGETQGVVSPVHIQRFLTYIICEILNACATFEP